MPNAHAAIDAAPVEAIAIRKLTAAEAEAALPRLGTLLADVVANGASVNFMHGFSPADGERFWRGQLALIAEGQRVLLVAESGAGIVGTVIVTFAPQPNQPHRADIGKMLVHSTMRRRGLGRRLLTAAEEAARAAGRTLLVLDTETGSAGHALYAACGWIEVGTIPGYALTPDGRPSGATIFYKVIAGV